MRAFITIEYNGGAYLGWQKNGEQKTICYELERAFSRVLSQEIKIVASGRTDAGVHAVKQSAHFDFSNKEISLKALLHAVNRILPIDVRITSIKEVSERFHARYNVKSKTYLYKCYTSPISSPLKEGFFCHYPSVLNIDSMKKCASQLIGEHNFKAFCLSGSDAENFVRRIISIDIMRKKDEIYFYVKGKGFLYSMVRLIVGTLLAVGEGKITCEQVKISLETGDKNHVGKKVDACGLYLYDVEY